MTGSKKLTIGCLVALGACLVFSIAAYFGIRLLSHSYATYSMRVKCDEPAGKPQPQSAQEYVERGEYYVENGDDSCAILAFSEAIRLDPNQLAAYLHRSKVYERRAEYDLAIGDLTEALRVRPRDSSVYIDRGRLLERKRDYTSAIHDYSQAIAIEPLTGVAYSFRANAYFRNLEHDRAISDYTEAIRIDPTNLAHYISRAEVYRATGEFELARADEKRARQERAISQTIVERARALNERATQESGQRVVKDLSGDALLQTATHQVGPAYPPLARAARVSGRVVVEVTIDASGNVTLAKAISGHPLLKSAALDAARQWRFRPSNAQGTAVIIKGNLTFDVKP
jgi:TonB family protein